MALSSRAAALAAVLLITPFAASTADAAARVSIDGAAATTTTICGAAQQVHAVKPGDALSLLVAPARSAAARKARVGSTVQVDRCANGQWTRERSFKLGARRSVLRKRLDTRVSAAGDLRLRARTRRGKSGAPVYVRIGAGEIVDVPITFQVVNQNRTSVPCLNAPDGKPYTVTGSLVAPRSLLQSDKRTVTLYLHGLGYSGFFFRFKDVPGYDYGVQQAQAGHASVVITRLGNPQDNVLPDGNATCFSSQADIADQIIGKLKAGDYSLDGASGTPFSKVALAGHSAGGFIAEITQYSFHSADALADISFSDYAIAPLTLQTFLTAGGTCLTAPEHADGETGAPNYAPFGATDADFVAGHVHNMDPEVEKIVLARRTRDPCGDLIGAAAALVANQPLVRTITGPVLVISGFNDALFPPPTNRLQAATGYPMSTDVSLVQLPETGHAVTLGRTHEAFRAAMDTWLTKHGF